jgi:CheY-like chemotaxis protein
LTTMIANCPHCMMTLSFDDVRLPKDPFSVVCPRCRQTVTVAPPPKEEPRLPGAPADPKPTAPVETEQLLRAFAEMMASMLKQGQPHPRDFDKWHRRRILLCLEDLSLRERVRASLDQSRYEVFSASTAAEALEILQESRAEIITLSPSFDPEHQGGAVIMQYVNRLTSQLRRRTYVALVSPQLRTLDAYLAFANSVNLTVHTDDADSFQSILERSIHDFNDLYKPYNQAVAADPF